MPINDLYRRIIVHALKGRPRGPYMRAPVCLIEFIKRLAKYRSTNVRFYLSYDMKITLKSQKKLPFWHYVRNVFMDVITFPENLLTNSG